MQSHRWQALAALDDEEFEARKAASARAAVAGKMGFDASRLLRRAKTGTALRRA
jgi:hypothetical protein